MTFVVWRNLLHTLVLSRFFLSPARQRLIFVAFFGAWRLEVIVEIGLLMTAEWVLQSRMG